MVIWDEVQTCIWPSRCHCHSLSLAPVNPDWFYLPGFWPTVLSIEPMVQYVCLSVCNVLYCGKTVRPSQKVSEGVNKKPGSKSSFFRSPPYFYFRFRRYGHRDGRFCLIFARTAKQLVLDGRNLLSRSKPCAYCRILRSELKPGVVLALDLCSVKACFRHVALTILLPIPRAYLCITANDHSAWATGVACRGHWPLCTGHID